MLRCHKESMAIVAGKPPFNFWVWLTIQIIIPNYYYVNYNIHIKAVGGDALSGYLQLILRWWVAPQKLAPTFSLGPTTPKLCPENISGHGVVKKLRKVMDNLGHLVFGNAAKFQPITSSYKVQNSTRSFFSNIYSGRYSTITFDRCFHYARQVLQKYGPCCLERWGGHIK